MVIGMVPVIDASHAITAFHQNHTYDHKLSVTGEDTSQTDNLNLDQVYNTLINGPEAKRNIELCGGEVPSFSPWDATYILTKSGSLKRLPLIEHLYMRVYRFKLPILPLRIRPFSTPLEFL